ncbi:inorganic diphosphatase [Bacteroidota bacterium]
MNNRKIKSRILSLFILIFLISFACTKEVDDNDEGLKYTDDYTLVGEKSFLDGYDPINAVGNINVVVEIPTGTVDKWEVIKPDGIMKWEFKNNEPRKVKYLGYPGNYGMIPKTLLSEDDGGDGDPIDVIVLGPAAERGSIITTNLIGVLKMLDGGEKDDKLIAVMSGTPLYDATSIDDLNEMFKGVTDIIQTWFANYKGPGEIEVLGFGDENEARDILDAAIQAFIDTE